MTGSTDIAGQLRSHFESRHDVAPDAVAMAPGRINLIGEHLDYNGGRSLPMALPLATYAAVRLRADETVTIGSLQQDEPWTGRLDGLGPGHVDGWPAYVAGVLWAMRERGVEVPGLDVLVDGHVPLGAGLSSSAALECSVALAVGAALGHPDTEANRRQLVEDCIRAEREVAGAPTGGMDQTISLLAQEGHALLLDSATGATTLVPWSPGDTGLSLLVVDTRASHELNDGGYASRRASCEDAARQLGVALLADVTDADAALERLEGLAGDEVIRRRARHVFTEIERVAAAVRSLAAADFEAFGARLTESHASLRDDFEVSCVELDVVVETCLAHGALGARMTGGGFGGSAIALLPDTAVAATRDALRAEFAQRQWPEPGMWQVTPSAGARVLSD